MPKQHRRRALSVALVLSIAVSAAGSTPGKPVVPPYTDAVTFTRCLPTDVAPTTSECHASATADRSTGAVGINVVVTSPVDGLLPGSGFASAAALVVATYTLQRAAPRVDFTITIHLNSATAVRFGEIHQPPAGTDPATGARTFTTLSHDSCESCVGRAPDISIVCIDSTSPSPVQAPCRHSVSNEDLIVEGYIFNPEDRQVPPGPITIQTGIDGMASLGFFPPIDTGQSLIAVDAVVTRITVRAA